VWGSKSSEIQRMRESLALEKERKKRSIGLCGARGEIVDNGISFIWKSSKV